MNNTIKRDFIRIRAFALIKKHKKETENQSENKKVDLIKAAFDIRQTYDMCISDDN